MNFDDDIFWGTYEVTGLFLMSRGTLPKFNIAPEKLPSQYESSLPTTIFQGLC